MKDYPDNITWMIEVRDWPDDEEPVATPERPAVPEWMRWVPEPVTAFGTGVVIRLEHLTPDNKPMQPAQIKNYLLTCGHVVRVKDGGFGPVAKEIVCWHPEYGYIRTKRGNPELNEGRRKGQMEGGHKAGVSPLSPYEGRVDAVPEPEREPHLDWVLLEVEDMPGRDSFETEPSVSRVEKPKPGEKTVVVGYPAGAGWATMASQWKAGAYFLQDNKPPEAKHAGEHGIGEVANHIISYHEVVDARPGMSGGGVFRVSDQALVGLHRSRDDAALDAQAICVADVLEWLRTRRHMCPVFSDGKRPAPPPWKRWLIASMALLAACTLGAYFWLKPKPVTYVWRGAVQEILHVDGVPQRRAVNGALIVPHLNNEDAVDLKVMTPSPSSLGPGEFEILTTNSAYYTDAAKLKISKEGYKTLTREAQAVIPSPDGQHRRIYTLIRQSTP